MLLNKSRPIRDLPNEPAVRHLKFMTSLRTVFSQR